MFRIGQKVVCVLGADILSPGSNCGWHEDCDMPVVGAIYTIRETGTDSFGAHGIKLCEIRWCGNILGTFIRDGLYWAARFRPVTERKTDISIFQAMLTPSPVTVDVVN